MKNWMKVLVAVVLGAVAGLLYYQFFGCTSGCPITSNRGFVVLYMMVLFGLFSSAFLKKEK